MVCCGKTFVSTNEWACNATIAHTREIVLYNRYEKEYYWNRKYYLNNISYTILSTRLELVWIENRHANDISTQLYTVASFSRVTVLQNIKVLQKVK